MYSPKEPCGAAKIVLMIRDSIPGSQLKVDFYPSKVGKLSTQLMGGGAMCSMHNLLVNHPESA